jgi:hypothetical protein
VTYSYISEDKLLTGLSNGPKDEEEPREMKGKLKILCFHTILLFSASIKSLLS